VVANYVIFVIANYIMCVVANYVGVFNSIEFTTTHIAFLVNICMATKNATCVFVILVANFFGVFDNK
jgi:hypothetical protein